MSWAELIHISTFAIWDTGQISYIPTNMQYYNHNAMASDATITSLKLTLDTLEQGVKICSKLTIKKPERCHYINNVLVSLLLSLNIFTTLFYFSIVNFEPVNADCAYFQLGVLTKVLIIWNPDTSQKGFQLELNSEPSRICLVVTASQKH